MVKIKNQEKIFVLDTNVLLLDPFSMFNFEENKVIIPIAVIEEIDSKKIDQDSVGFNARQVSRNLDELRNSKKLHEGVELPNGGTLSVFTEGLVAETSDYEELFSEKTNFDSLDIPFLKPNKADNRILSTAMYMQKNYNKKVVLVSNDTNMRIMADALGLNANDYQTNKVDLNFIKNSFHKEHIKTSLIDGFYKNSKIPIENLTGIDTEKICPNEFVKFTDGEKSMIGRYNKAKKEIVPFIFKNFHPSGISARNTEQQLALELLLNDNIKIVTLTGKAGTGKTLIALACGLHQTIETNKYQKLSVARPLVAMGNELGYFPGDKEEKLNPWMNPIYDNLELLIKNKDRETRESAIDYLKESGVIEIEALSYIRGRSIPNNFLIIDESQNLTPHEVKTIVTRVGEGSKIVFTGDAEQIDSPYLNEQTNGLVYLAEKFKNESIAGHINLVEGERSELAEIASKIL